MSENMKIAILIPCYNEGVTIHKVVLDFSAAIPESEIYVFDNNSTDNTIEQARSAGAIVRTEPLQGKGNVLRRMFADVDADIYVLVDGDDTYDASAALELVQHLLENNLDMVNAARHSELKQAYRLGHRFGNSMLTGMVRLIFGNRVRDMLSGYRVFSRRFVKSFPALSEGFEIETELTVHALELRMPIAELDTRYKDRPEGSSSKLRTIHDGISILRQIAALVRKERPLAFFGTIFTILAIVSLGLGWSILVEFIDTGLVPRLPTAILATGIMLVAFLAFTVGLVLDTVTHGRRELKRLYYLSMPTPFITDKPDPKRSDYS